MPDHSNGQPKVAEQVVRTREQKGHSIIKHIFLGWCTAYMLTIYYALSKDHYFHL